MEGRITIIDYIELLRLKQQPYSGQFVDVLIRKYLGEVSNTVKGRNEQIQQIHDYVAVNEAEVTKEFEFDGVKFHLITDPQVMSVEHYGDIEYLLTNTKDNLETVIPVACLLLDTESEVSYNGNLKLNRQALVERMPAHIIYPAVVFFLLNYMNLRIILDTSTTVKKVTERLRDLIMSRS